MQQGSNTKFPVTRNELLQEQGWKVFDLTENEHVHASMLLEKLPERRYTGVEDVIGVLKRRDRSII